MATFTALTRISGSIQSVSRILIRDPALKGSISSTDNLFGAIRKDGQADISGSIQSTDNLSTITQSILVLTGSGAMSFEKMLLIAADKPYADARVRMEALTGEAEDEFAAGTYSISDGSFAYLTSQGHMFTGQLGQGVVSFQPMITFAADRPFGQAIAAFAPMAGLAFEDLVLPEFLVISDGFALAHRKVLLPQFIFTNSNVTQAIRAVTGTAASLITVLTPAFGVTMSDVTAPNTILVFSDAIVSGAESTVLAFNAETFAATRYVGYNYVSFATFRGRHYGANVDGLFELTGDSDAGEDIDASIILGRLNFGSSHLKRMYNAYISGVSEGSLSLRVFGDDDKIREYKTKVPLGDIIRYRRVGIAKGLKMHYWQFEVRNEFGQTFDLHSMDLYPIVLQRRVKK